MPTYGHYISQADRNERKLYPGREPKPRKNKVAPVRTQEEIDLCIKLFGYDPVESEAQCDDWQDECQMYSDLRGG